MLLFTLLVLYHTIVRRLICTSCKDFLSASLRLPCWHANLFIINTALVQPVRRIILTLVILALFDMSLSAAAFYGIGAVLEMCRL